MMSRKGFNLLQGLLIVLGTAIAQPTVAESAKIGESVDRSATKPLKYLLLHEIY
jgi:hypothetical protein